MSLKKDIDVHVVVCMDTMNGHARIRHLLAHLKDLMKHPLVKG